MSKIFGLLISDYRREKLRNNLFFKLAMGCLSLLFLVFCVGICIVLLLMPNVQL